MNRSQLVNIHQAALRPLLCASCAWLLASLNAFALIDVNANGMSDLWEQQFNSGSLFPNIFLPVADDDGDGATNMEEAIADTDPRDGTPPGGHFAADIDVVPPTYGPPVNGVPELLTPETFVVSWPTKLGKRYTLQFSTTLAAGSWMPVGDTVVGTNARVATAVVPEPRPASLFWRVAVSDIDTNGNLVTDWEEYRVLEDSDDDGVPDYWELQYRNWLANHFSIQNLPPSSDLFNVNIDYGNLGFDAETYFANESQETPPGYDSFADGVLYPSNDYSHQYYLQTGLEKVTFYSVIKSAGAYTHGYIYASNDSVVGEKLRTTIESETSWEADNATNTEQFSHTELWELDTPKLWEYHFGFGYDYQYYLTRDPKMTLSGDFTRAKDYHLSPESAPTALKKTIEQGSYQDVSAEPWAYESFNYLSWGTSPQIATTTTNITKSDVTTTTTGSEGAPVYGDYWGGDAFSRVEEDGDDNPYAFTGTTTLGNVTQQLMNLKSIRAVSDELYDLASSKSKVNPILSKVASIEGSRSSRSEPGAGYQQATWHVTSSPHQDSTVLVTKHFSGGSTSGSQTTTKYSLQTIPAGTTATITEEADPGSEFSSVGIDVSLLPLDIVARNSQAPEAPENGLCVKAGASITFDINGTAPPEDFPFPSSSIEWQTRQIKQDGNFTQWLHRGNGREWTEEWELSGIFQLKAILTLPDGSKHEYQMKRKKDVKHAENWKGEVQELHKAGSPDYFGVSFHPWQVAVRDHVVACLGDTGYALTASVPINSLAVGDLLVFGPSADKCNLFVYHKVNDIPSAPRVSLVRGGAGPLHTSPPLAIDWWNDNSGRPDNMGRMIESVDIPGYTRIPDSDYPEPGFIASRAKLNEPPDKYHAHCGILDYDGSWVSAGQNKINKYCHILTSEYQPLALKK